MPWSLQNYTQNEIRPTRIVGVFMKNAYASVVSISAYAYIRSIVANEVCETGPRRGGLYVLSTFGLHQRDLPARMPSHMSQNCSPTGLLCRLLGPRLQRSLSTLSC